MSLPIKNVFCLVFFTLAFPFISIFSQDVLPANSSPLDLMFSDYSVQTIDSRALVSTARSGGFFTMDIPKKDGGVWKVELYESKIIGDNYLSQYVDETGLHKGERTTAVPTTGIIKGDNSSSVSLTFNDGFIYGFIRDESGYSYIEPLSYFDKETTLTDQFVIYHTEDVRETAPKTCGSTELHKRQNTLDPSVKEKTESRSVDECFELDYAIANDWLMFENLGSVAAVENHAIGVTNNVQTNYDDDFTDEIQIIIVTQFTVTTSNGDPWDDTTSAGDLLDSFTGWGPGGFGVTHDVGSLWTNRNFNGSTVGIAWLSVICQGFRYNCLEDFTNNAASKRVLTSHELGHNFSSNHDNGGGFIMSPSVNITDTWSAQSINSIENHIATRTCLADCAGTNVPPIADFSFTVIEDCTVGEVIFINESTGPDLDFQWEFPGGNPSFSTAEDPSVFYASAGTYDATLTVTNAGGEDVMVQNNIFTITDSPLLEFATEIEGTIVSFFNFSQFVTTYSWDFGDGAFSNESDPVHDYLDDGVYIVTLTGTSICGDEIIEEVIVIANPPTADFDADIQSGCAPIVVQYTSTSSNNTDDYLWTFEGGIPETSTEENPLVEYPEGGDYDVTLTVLNETGDDIIQFTDFIEVTGIPVADFTFMQNENEITLTNLSQYSENVLWNFGDGNTSTEENPVHVYATDGDFTITLTVDNECGNDEASTSISVSLAPLPSFSISGTNIGCAPMTIDYVSTSTNSPDSFSWIFEGGTPATSDIANPSVTYNTAGTFDVSLSVSNSNGSNSITFSDFVDISVAPEGIFSFVEDGLNVSFTDESDDADSFEWMFGDGNSSTMQNPEYTYAQEGEYTVTLTTTNECGSNTTTQILNNYTPVSANFSSDITSGCSDLVVSYQDQSSANTTSWAWTFEGGTPATSTEQNPTVTYTTAGQFDAILVASHQESTETITLFNYIAVSDVPMTSFDYFDDLFDVDFNNTTIEGETFAWDFGDGNTSMMENPSHTYAAEGTYDVILVATNACGSTTQTATIEINALPTAGFNAENTSGCGPLTVQYNNASSSNVTAWSWSFEGGNPATSTEENPEVTYNTPGLYSVILTVTSEAGTDMIEMDDFVEVIAEPTADFSLVTEEISFSAIYSGVGATSFNWNVEGQDFNTEEINYTFSENGTFTVTLTVENECGTDMTSFEVTITSFPEAMIDNLPITVCVGEPVTLSDNSTNAQNRLWTLLGADPSTSTDNTPTVTYNSVGTFDIKLEVTNVFGSSEETFTGAVNVIAEPIAEFLGDQVGNEVTFTNNSSGATTYFWDFGDDNTSDEQNPTHTYDVNGEFIVTLTVTNICGEVSSTETYIVNTNSVSESDLFSMKVYPNPANQFLNVDINNDTYESISLTIIDVQGRVVKKETFNSNSYSINTSALTTGTYMLRLSTDEQTHYRKVVIMR